MSIKTINFVTSNQGKFEEISNYFKELCPDITLEQVLLEVPEIQSLNVEEIALHKAQYAWNVLKKPLIIDDGGIYLEQYNNFPGPLAKWVFQGIGLEGFWRLAQSDPRVFFLCKIIYIDGPENYITVEGKLSGTVIEPKNLPKDLHLPYTEVFIPEGFNEVFSLVKKTPAGKKINHRYKAICSLVEKLKC